MMLDQIFRGAIDYKPQSVQQKIDSCKLYYKREKNNLLREHKKSNVLSSSTACYLTSKKQFSGDIFADSLLFLSKQNSSYL